MHEGQGYVPQGAAEMVSVGNRVVGTGPSVEGELRRVYRLGKKGRRVQASIVHKAKSTTGMHELGWLDAFRPVPRGLISSRSSSVQCVCARAHGVQVLPVGGCCLRVRGGLKVGDAGLFFHFSIMPDTKASLLADCVCQRERSA